MNKRWTADMSQPIVDRVGKSPSELGITQTGESCPDIFRLNNGDYLIIGTNATGAYKSNLPPTAGCAEHEAIVMIPSVTLSAAAHDVVNGFNTSIPDTD